MENLSKVIGQELPPAQKEKILQQSRAMGTPMDQEGSSDGESNDINQKIAEEKLRKIEQECRFEDEKDFKRLKQSINEEVKQVTGEEYDEGVSEEERPKPTGFIYVKKEKPDESLKTQLEDIDEEKGQSKKTKKQTKADKKQVKQPNAEESTPSAKKKGNKQQEQALDFFADNTKKYQELGLKVNQLT